MSNKSIGALDSSYEAGSGMMLILHATDDNPDVWRVIWFHGRGGRCRNQAEQDSGQQPIVDCLHQSWQTIAGQDPLLPLSGASGNGQQSGEVSRDPNEKVNTVPKAEVGRVGLKGA